MKLSKAILVGICLLPLVTLSYAEEVKAQNMRIVERSVISVNETTPPILEMNNENVPQEGKSRAIRDTKDVEKDKKQGFRWPWERKDRPKGCIQGGCPSDR